MDDPHSPEQVADMLNWFLTKRTFTFPFQVWLKHDLDQIYGRQIQELHPALYNVLDFAEIQTVWGEYLVGKILFLNYGEGIV